MVIIVSKFQVPSSNGLGVDDVLRTWRKRMNDLIKDQTSDEAVKRAALTTMGLLNILQ